MNWSVPTIAGIQRMTALLTVAAAIVMLVVSSPAAAFACLIGGVFVIANLFVLTMVARAIIALAQGGTAAAKAGVLLAPLKLFFFVAVVYLLITRVRLDLPGFLLGTLTQFLAIFIETWHASSHGPPVRTEDERV